MRCPERRSVDMVGPLHYENRFASFFFGASAKPGGLSRIRLLKPMIVPSPMHIPQHVQKGDIVVLCRAYVVVCVLFEVTD